MKRIFLLLSTMSIIVSIHAQIKFGDNPTSINANSVLEVESTNKGLLLPRVTLTGTANVAPLSAHIAGMIVYNTATAGDVTPGYYYNDGSKWVRTADAANVGAEPWYNAATGTAATANTQNIYQLGNVGIGTVSPTQKLEVIGNVKADNFTVGDFTSVAKTIQLNSLLNGANNTISIQNLDGQFVINKARSSSSLANGQSMLITGVGSLNSGNPYWQGLHYSITDNITVNGSVTFPRVSNYISYSSLTNPTDLNFTIDAGNSGSLPFGITLKTANNAPINLNPSSGNVGIGTSTPSTQAKLDVNGSIKVGNYTGTLPEAGMIRFNTTTNTFQGYNGSAWFDF